MAEDLAQYFLQGKKKKQELPLEEKTKRVRIKAKNVIQDTDPMIKEIRESVLETGQKQREFFFTLKEQLEKLSLTSNPEIQDRLLFDLKQQNDILQKILTEIITEPRLKELLTQFKMNPGEMTPKDRYQVWRKDTIFSFIIRFHSETTHKKKDLWLLRRMGEVSRDLRIVEEKEYELNVWNPMLKEGLIEIVKNDPNKRCLITKKAIESYRMILDTDQVYGIKNNYGADYYIAHLEPQFISSLSKKKN